MLVLQIVVEAEALLQRKCSRITAIHRFLPSLPPYFFGAEKRQWPAASARRASLRFSSCFPFVARQALIVEIGARVFAAVVEEADIVVRLLERLDLGFDELVEFGQIGDCRSSGSKIEVHP